jgi:protein-disulfide isomerase
MSLKPAVSSKDHITGGANAPIELVEYGDYQCPHCGHAHPIIKSILHSLGKDIKFVFRNFPLQEAHPDAVPAAVSTEAAALQDKYWEMHDTLFEHQSHLSAEHLFVYADKTGLDVQKFATDIQKDDLLNKVQNDFESGIRSGVNGTPTFFINGVKYNGSWEKEDFLPYLQEKIKAAK